MNKKFLNKERRRFILPRKAGAKEEKPKYFTIHVRKTLSSISLPRLSKPESVDGNNGRKDGISKGSAISATAADRFGN